MKIVMIELNLKKVVDPGSITVTNNGGTVILEEVSQAVMVSTFETASQL